MENNLASHTPNLGKLSIALLEHLVEPLLGDSAIQEIKSPVKQRELLDAIGKSLINTENRFVNEHSNKDVSTILLSLPLSNLPSVIKAVQSFYAHPSDPSLKQLLFTQFISVAKDLPERVVQDAVANYLEILREELANIPGDFREVIETLATLKISENTARMAETLSRIENGLNVTTDDFNVTNKQLMINKILDSGLFDAPQFTDRVFRKNLVSQLKELVSQESVIAVEGLSGSGKSYLVSSLLETQVDELGYKSVLWYDPQIDDTLDNFITQTEAIIRLTGLSSQSKCKELLSLFRREKILLVIDNFEQVNQSSYSMLIDLAGRQGVPASVILISREYSELSQNLTGIRHFEVRGFDTNELQDYLESRGVNYLDKPTINKILDETDGLPLAAALFATLVTDFGRSVDELLGGKIIKANRLHQWFNDILSRMNSDEVKLLHFLSHCDVPFNRGIIKLAGTQTNIGDFELSFENIQRKYLVQRYTPYRWNVHRLISGFCQNNISSDEKRKINLAFAFYYEKGITIDRRKLIDYNMLNWLILSCKYYQRAEKYSKSERLLKDISKTIKSRGLYQIFIQLGSVELKENPKRDNWIDYDYAHCCFITGRVRQSMHAIETIIYTEMSNDWGKRLAITRLYAEILGSTGQEQIALEKLREVLDNAEMSSAHSTILNHARSIEVLLLTKLGKYTEAENICEELLAESAKQDVPRGGAVALTRLGIINKLRGNYEIANKQFAEAVQLFRDSDDRRGLGWSLLNLSDTELSLERFDLSYQYLQESLRVSADIGQSSIDDLTQLESIYPKIKNRKIKKLIESEIQRIKYSLHEAYT